MYDVFSLYVCEFLIIQHYLVVYLDTCKCVLSVLKKEKIGIFFF